MGAAGGVAAFDADVGYLVGVRNAKESELDLEYHRLVGVGDWQIQG